MITIQDVRNEINKDPVYWKQYIFSFVDDFRYYKKFSQVSDYIPAGDRYDYLLASITEYLCDELELPHPKWTDNIGRLESPWFLSELKSGKILGLVESPASFRRRDIFVGKDFLFRV
jgi:hypothetical protein